MNFFRECMKYKVEDRKKIVWKNKTLLWNEWRTCRKIVKRNKNTFFMRFRNANSLAERITAAKILWEKHDFKNSIFYISQEVPDKFEENVKSEENINFEENVKLAENIKFEENNLNTPPWFSCYGRNKVKPETKDLIDSSNPIIKQNMVIRSRNCKRSCNILTSSPDNFTKYPESLPSPPTNFAEYPGSLPFKLFDPPQYRI